MRKVRTPRERFNPESSSFNREGGRVNATDATRRAIAVGSLAVLTFLGGLAVQGSAQPVEDSPAWQWWADGNHAAGCEWAASQPPAPRNVHIIQVWDNAGKCLYLAGG